MLDTDYLAQQNARGRNDLNADYAHLGTQLRRRDVDIESITRRVQAFGVAIPSWGVGTGGTRFARFPGEGEPRNIEDKIADCSIVQQLTQATPTVSLHIPWDIPDDPTELRDLAAANGLTFDAMNSNTFQDQPDQRHSYKFGSLTHTDPAVRAHAVEHNLECIAIGRELGSTALTVWIADGGNFPGQQHFRRTVDRYLSSLQQIYAGLPDNWRLFLEHKLFEPAFYSTVNNDWGISYWTACQLGEKAQCLVDLGHHAPNVNIEMIVARLIQFRKLGGFHLNDSKYGDDDLDSGSIAPFQLFLIFHELVEAETEGVSGFDPAYMLDQSHNVTDPIESLMTSAIEAQRAYAKAWLVDRAVLHAAQEANDPMLALQTLKQAYETDVRPILAMARQRSGGAIDPLTVYRESGYRSRVARERGRNAVSTSGIV